MSKRFKSIPGLTMAQALSLDPAGTVYTFVEHNGTPTHIATHALYERVKDRVPITRCMIAPSLIHALESNNLGVEEPHALKLTDAALEVPALVCCWGENDHVIADGNHRLWRRWKRGDEWFPAYVIPEELWRHFTIRDMPGTGDFWSNWNKTAQVRTPEMERLVRLLRGER